MPLWRRTASPGLQALFLLTSVFLTSVALLAYEIVLMRVFAITQWSHFAYLVISLALLGFGASGTVLVLGGQYLRRHERVVAPMAMALFAGAMVLCFRWSQSIDLNVLELPWRASAAWKLGAVALILMLPFVLGAGAVGLVLSAMPRRSMGLYAANLLGSGVGAAAVVPLLWVLEPNVALVPLSAAALLAAALAIGRIDTRRARLVAGVPWGPAALLVVLAIAHPQTLALKVNPFKGLEVSRHLPEARRVAQAPTPLGRLDVLTSPAIREAPGLSFRAPGATPHQMLLFTDADAGSAVNVWAHRDDLRVLDFTTAALGYHVRRPETVCVIGPGGGADLDLAYYHGSRRVHAVELNRRVLEVLAEARGQGGVPYDPRVMDSLTLAVAEGRGFLERTGERFDLIQVSLLDSLAASSAGVYALSESYLYTVEALRATVRALSPTGVVAFTRWIKPPERDVLKLLATAAEALEAEKLEPAARLVLIRGLNTATLLVSAAPFTPAEVARVSTFCAEREFDLECAPGMAPGDLDRVFSQPIYREAAAAILSHRRAEFLRGYPFEIRPATDDRPFFFHFLRPRMLLHLRESLGTNWRPFVEWGYVVMLVTLVAAAVLSALLILAPLALVRRSRTHGPQGPPTALGGKALRLRRLPLILYCLCLGLSFLFVEMAFIQKFILFLSYPLYAISVIIAGFLLLAGVGSWLAGRWSGGRHFVAPAVAVIAVVSVAYAFFLNPLLRALIGWPDWARIATTLLLLAPLAIPMGVPFPAALRRIGAASETLVPWAWGINGCASVVAAPLATVLAVSFGFRAVVLIAAVLYLLAGLVFHRLPAEGGHA